MNLTGYAIISGGLVVGIVFTILLIILVMTVLNNLFFGTRRKRF